MVESAFPAHTASDGYLFSDNGKYILLNIAPGDGVAGVNPVDAIEADLKRVRAEFPGIEAGMTGGPALARTEERTTAHDIALASVIAIVSSIQHRRTSANTAIPSTIAYR